MSYNAPYMPHELDSHPDAKRILASLDEVKVEAEREYETWRADTEEENNKAWDEELLRVRDEAMAAAYVEMEGRITTAEARAEAAETKALACFAELLARMFPVRKAA